MSLQVFHLMTRFQFWDQRIQALNFIKLNHTLAEGDCFAEKNRTLHLSKQVSIWLKNDLGTYKRSHIGHFNDDLVSLVFKDFNFQGSSLDGKLFFDGRCCPVKFFIKKLKIADLNNESVNLYLEQLSKEKIEDLSLKNILSKDRGTNVTSTQPLVAYKYL